MHDRTRVLALVAALAALAIPGRARAASEKRITSASSWVPIHGVNATLAREFTPTGLLMVDTGVDVPDAALRGRAQRMLPRLRDAMRASLAEYAFSRHRPNTVPDADLIARMLQTAVDRTLGASGAQVLLANVLVQDRR